MKAVMPVSIVLGTCLLALVLWLVRAQMRAGAARRLARAGYFDALGLLFDRVERQIQPSGFARMTGHLGAHAFDLQAVPDTLTFRKLPALWVMVTLPEPLPVLATLDVMARPTGGEPFSHFAQLAQGVDCPAFLPEGTALRSDDAARAPVHLLAMCAAVFGDARVKELVISPKGLRLVILAEEADRGRYLLFRDAEMGAEALPAARIAPVLETLLALRALIIPQKVD